MSGAALAGAVRNDGRRGQLLYPVVDDSRHLVGVVTRGTLRRLTEGGIPTDRPLAELARQDPVVAYADEPLSVVVYRMAETGLTRFPVSTGPETAS